MKCLEIEKIVEEVLIYRYETRSIEAFNLAQIFFLLYIITTQCFYFLHPLFHLSEFMRVQKEIKLATNFKASLACSLSWIRCRLNDFFAVSK